MIHTCHDLVWKTSTGHFVSKCECNEDFKEPRGTLVKCKCGNSNLKEEYFKHFWEKEDFKCNQCHAII